MSTPVGSSQWMYTSASGFYPYLIDQSLRFDDPNNAYLLRNTNAGDRQKWTWSAWVKRSTLGTRQAIFSEGSSSSSHATYFDTDDTILTQERNGGSNRYVNQTSAVFRDVGAWMHICYAVDTTQATDSDRLKLYVNGVLQTLVNVAASTYPSLNLSTNMNVGSNHFIGYAATNANLCFDGYMAELHFVDGTQYAATDFAEEINGIWVPKEFTGSHGTYGYYLNFSTNSFTDNATDPDVFADQAGSNDLNAYNLAASDVVLDSPTNNFATLNPLNKNTTYPVTLSEGNLKIGLNSGGYRAAASTISVTSGKFYAEFRNYIANNNTSFGFQFANQSLNGVGPAGGLAGEFGMLFSGAIYDEGTLLATASGVSNSGIGRIAIDLDAGKGWVGVDSDFFDSSAGTTGDPATGANATFTFTAGTELIFLCKGYTATAAGTANFGQDSTFAGATTAGGNADDNGIGDFAYAPPSGFLALCTVNLPEPTISPNAAEQADDYFDTVLYTGDGTNPGDAQEINGLSFQPDFVWVKGRSGTQWHELHDSVRGVGNRIFSNETNAENDRQTMTSFDNDGFTVAIGTAGNNGTNENGSTYVGWSWKAGGTAVSNTDGSITSQVSSAPDAGFSIVSYTGNLTSGATVGHGLSEKPEIIFVKNRDSAQNWNVWNKDLTSETVLYLNLTAAQNNSPASFGTHTNQVFGVDNSVESNGNGNAMIAYCFHSVDGFSKVGSMELNNNPDGTFVYLGFRPALVIAKRIDGIGNWNIFDNTRDAFNDGDLDLLQADTTTAESAFAVSPIDLLSNGFKLRHNSANGYVNTATDTAIFYAVAEQPFKYANAR